ncbi:MAG: DNA-binding domain-containing protein [Candidatus Promineifilaceae bacterium]
MTIEYTLVENKLNTSEGTYRAMVQPKDTIDLAGIIDRMVRRGNTLMREDAMAVQEAYHDTLLQVLQEGYNVTTPTANYRASIKGVFDGPDDSFDPSRHKLEVRVNPGLAVRPSLEKVPVVKTEHTTPLPHPQVFHDHISHLDNSVVTPGGGAKIKGYRLKFDQTDPEQGVFFVSASGVETRVEQVLSIRPSEVIIILPALPADMYRLEVRGIFGKIVRAGSLTQKLTVA